MKLILHKSDVVGAFASTLCMIHCIATPLLFIVQSCSGSGCEAAPEWWRNIDYLFLFISFFAVYRSAQTTLGNFIKPALWISWISLFIIVANEKLKWFPLSEYMIYVAAIVLVVLHLYNLNYCRCKTDNCCKSYG